MNKILLVEDDHYLGIILNDQLELHGYEVNLLRFPNQAVENLQQDNFDMVIMDKLLSGIDGTQVCKAIRNTEGISNTPILMMSGMDGARQVCLAAGATNFIPKPFEIDEFLESIEATINMSKDHHR